jgi:hypothetical protein
MFNQRLLYAALTSTLALVFHISAPAQSVDRSQTLKEVEALKKELIEKEKQFLSPSAEDQAKFAEFLKRPYSGLIRLFPRGLYDDVLLKPGGASFYSFARLSYDFASDIEFRPIPKEKDDAHPPIEEYQFGTSPNGFIVMIGDVPLEKVTLTDDVIKFLSAYAPPSTIAEARAGWRRRLDWIEENGYEYKKYVPVIVNRTYALRSIVYGGKGNSDILVVFRVVRKATDESVLILWNMLVKFPAPPAPR